MGSVAEIALVGAGRTGGMHLRALADAPSIRVTDVVEGAMSAAGVIGALPILLFSALVQKHLVRGLTMGAVK